MKTHRKNVWGAVLLAALAWASPHAASAQGLGGGAANRDEAQGRAAERLLERVQGSAELQEEAAALRESIDALHEIWLVEFRPGDNATAEEIRAAREAFQNEYAEQIEANKQLRLSLTRELRSGASDRLDDANWSEEAREQYQEYHRIQTHLADAWNQARAALGPDATREEIEEAKRRFQEANAELIEQQKELAKQVRELIRENRQPPGLGRPELPDALKNLRNEIATLRQQAREQRRLAQEELRGKTREEREQQRQELLNELRGIHDDIKERRRQVIEDLRDGQDGDRRPEG